METLSNITDMTDALSLYFDDNDGEIMNHQWRYNLQLLHVFSDLFGNDRVQ
jgi:hypothetical protein